MLGESAATLASTAFACIPVVHKSAMHPDWYGPRKIKQIISAPHPDVGVGPTLTFRLRLVVANKYEVLKSWANF